MSVRFFSCKQFLLATLSAILLCLATVNQSVSKESKDKNKPKQVSKSRNSRGQKEKQKRKSAKATENHKSKKRSTTKKKERKGESENRSDRQKKTSRANQQKSEKRKADRRVQRNGSEKKQPEKPVNTEVKPGQPLNIAHIAETAVKIPDLPVNASSQQIVNSLNLGTGEALKSQLDGGGVELKVLGNSGRYAPQEAMKVLDLFFSQYKPQSTAVLHKGKTKTGLTYLLGKINCTNLKEGSKQSEIDLYVVYKVNGNNISIRTLELN